jgi:hypothetical protein
MPDATPYGPSLADRDDVYRAILYPMHWNEAAQCPSSAAFDCEVFSVDIASRTTPAETRSRFRQVVELVQFNAGLARAIGFDSRDEIDAQFPENKAHAHVYFVGYAELSRGKRKAAARKLCDLCSVVRG